VKPKLIYTISSGLFFLIIVFPIIYIIFPAFINFFNISFNANVFILLFKSILISSVIALLSTIFGIVLAFLLYKTNISYGKFFKIILLIPLFISPYILAVAWKDFAFFTLGKSNLINSYLGVIIILTTVFTPLSILIIGSALTGINSNIEDAAFMFVSLKKTIFKIVLPLIKPPIITSFVLVFIFSISEFSVPAFLGVKVFTSEIFIQFSAFYNHSLAILQSLLLVLICVGLLFSERKYISDAPFFSIGTRGTKSKIYKLNKAKLPAFLFVSFWMFISIISPFLMLFFQSFKNGTDKFVQAFTLLSSTFSNSFFLAITGASLIVLVGILASFPNKNKFFDWLLLIVFAIPSTIIGISLIKFYNQEGLNFIYSSSAIILIGYIAKFSFVSSKLIGNAIKQIPKSLNELAQIQGVTFLKRLQNITLPLILPTLFVTFMLSFIFCFGELGLTIMLYPPGTEIMPIKVFTIMANAPQALTSSMSLIVFSITLMLIIGFYFFMKPLFKKYNSFL